MISEKLKQIFRFLLSTPCLLFIVYSSLFFTINSCQLINPSQDIPSYIYIEKFIFKSNISGDTDSQNITDAWVYIDDQLIGAFELPSKFPVLITGKHHTVTVKAGIKLNGISATRAVYPLYAPYVAWDVELPQGKVVNINPSTSYIEKVKNFVWKENFENPSSIKFKNNNSIKAVRYDSLSANDYFAYGGIFTGMVKLSPQIQFFEIVTDTAYVLPHGNIPVFLEFNYKTNNSFIITLEIYTLSDSRISKQEVITINKSDNWNKIYVNLTPYVNLYSDAQKYKIYFNHWLDDGVSNGLIFLDNIKLITYN